MPSLNGIVTAAQVVGGAVPTAFNVGSGLEAFGQAWRLSGQDPNNTGIGRRLMGNFVYPSDLANEDIGRKAYMTIKFKAYQRRSIFDTSFFKPIGGITLPIPSSLADSTSVNWSQSQKDAQNAAVGGGIEQYLNGKNQPGSPTSEGFKNSISEALKGNYEGLAKTGGDVAKGAVSAYGANYLSGMLGGAGAQVLQLSGLAANPFLTMLFESPNFKTHSFSWSFAPRNAQESSTIAAIVAAFKYNMLPGLSGSGTGGTFFTYPNIANISLYPTDQYLYTFKPCAIKSFTADFAPNGPSFFKDTYAPTHINLSVEMTEIELWTKESITGRHGGGNINSAILGGLSAIGGAIGRAFDDTVNPRDGNQSPLQQIPISPEGIPGYTPGA